MQEEAASKGIKVDACRAMERFDKSISGGLTRTRTSPCMLCARGGTGARIRRSGWMALFHHGGGCGAIALVVFTGRRVPAWRGAIFSVQALRWPIRRE
ncbi:hypothetical protein AA19596_0144 [Acetobacter fabarum DSM 19596]|nr:hypothetical protein AA19596_0144 [Acetobacter fabarum DSM 19596]